MSSRAWLAATAILVVVWPAHATAQTPPSPSPHLATTPSTSPSPAPVEGRIVLRPGVIEVRAGGALPAALTLTVPEPLDFNQLVTLVAGQAGGRTLLERTSSGVVEVRVPIDQRPGSRLAINGGTVPKIVMIGRGRLVGQDAILSINGTSITASGTTPGRPGVLNPLIGYRDGSGVRMSRVRIVDQRDGPGAGPAIQLAGGDAGGGQLRIISALVSGGIGALRLDGVVVAELVGVQVERSLGAGVNAGGGTHLVLRDVTIDRNTGPGLALSGHALTVSTGGVVRLERNGGEQLTRHGTGALNLSGIQIVPNPPAARPMSRTSPGNRSRGDAELPLSWIVTAAGALLAGAVVLEGIRDR